MEAALVLAEKARGKTSPNPLVGALVVKDGEIVGRGYHQKAGGPHAEVFALEEAGGKAQGATLYVTLEPCSHYGRTPPCTEKIIASGVKKVVAAMVDPNPKVAGLGLQQLRKAGIEVEIGLCEDEAKRLNQVFLKYISTGKPFVILKTGMSLDGKIATRNGDSKWITSEESRAYVHQIRDQVDAIMVGIGTILKDDPQLTTRLPAGPGNDPIRIIVDSSAQIPVSCKVLNQQSSAETIIATTTKASPEKISLLEAKGARILVVEEKNGHVNMHKLMDQLGKLEITSLLVEGGSSINGAVIRDKLVDKVFFFIAPKIIGGEKAPSPIGGIGVETMKEVVRLKDYQMRPIGSDFLIEGYLDY